jgi:hypothetical protein
MIRAMQEGKIKLRLKAGRISHQYLGGAGALLASHGFFSESASASVPVLVIPTRLVSGHVGTAAQACPEQCRRSCPTERSSAATVTGANFSRLLFST